MVEFYWLLTRGFSPTATHAMTAFIYLYTSFLPSFLTYLLTYLLTPWNRVLLEKINGFQLVKKFPAFYETQRFITALTIPLHPVPILNQFNPVHNPTFHFLKIHLNITLPSMPWSPKWLVSLRFPHQKRCIASPLPHTRYMPHPSHSSQFYHPHDIG